MRKWILCLVCGLAVVGAATAAAAGEVTVRIANGRATVIAKDVPVRQILAEWAKVGDTKITNAERIAGGPVTLELIDVPEKEALSILLRTVAGYIAAPRPANMAGASQFDRIIVMPTSRAPVASASAPPPAFGRPAVQPVIQQPPPDDDDGEPGDQGPMPPPVMGPNGAVQAFPGPAVGPNGQIMGAPVPMNVPVGPNGVPLGPNGMPMNQAPTTAPRPGQLPQQAQPGVPPNPYAPAGRPGPTPIRPGGQSDR